MPSLAASWKQHSRTRVAVLACVSEPTETNFVMHWAPSCNCMHSAVFISSAEWFIIINSAPPPSELSCTALERTWCSGVVACHEFKYKSTTFKPSHALNCIELPNRKRCPLWNIYFYCFTRQDIYNVRFEVFTAVTMKNGSCKKYQVFLRCLSRLLVTASVVPSSPILVTLMQ
jgi:hypothetical protein